MSVGQTVSVSIPSLPRRKGYTEWNLDNLPTRGIIEYISPHGFVVLMMLSNKTDKPLYRESFWIYELGDLK